MYTLIKLGLFNLDEDERVHSYRLFTQIIRFYQEKLTKTLKYECV